MPFGQKDFPEGSEACKRGPDFILLSRRQASYSGAEQLRTETGHTAVLLYRKSKCDSEIFHFYYIYLSDRLDFIANMC